MIDDLVTQLKLEFEEKLKNLNLSSLEKLKFRQIYNFEFYKLYEKHISIIYQKAFDNAVDSYLDSYHKTNKEVLLEIIKK